MNIILNETRQNKKKKEEPKTLADIIIKCPKTAVVRRYMNKQLQKIKDKQDQEFLDIDEEED